VLRFKVGALLRLRAFPTRYVALGILEPTLQTFRAVMESYSNLPKCGNPA